MVQLELSPILSTNWESSVYLNHAQLMGIFTGTQLFAAIDNAIVFACF